jgi:hypothetical protein|uniref:Uncharacterized protein n=1 Tax=Oryza sativa subsp. japonica TaxID=39947 RepID=Q6H6P7_ORYSJ|nr:hypothetical protein [Oryza sativa Japonica Group]BAD25602.1 hypothetical protein [Oryza sativa Japonica Group]
MGWPNRKIALPNPLDARGVASLLEDVLHFGSPLFTARKDDGPQATRLVRSRFARVLLPHVLLNVYTEVTEQNRKMKQQSTGVAFFHSLRICFV